MSFEIDFRHQRLEGIALAACAEKEAIALNQNRRKVQPVIQEPFTLPF
ncbi:hypothetical protein [Polycladidibacter stylochi]|nr:hypothetical protein [Pseudovibrio stylochi]